MPRPFYAVGLEAEGSIIQDRASVIEVGDALVIAVADGAGGAGRSEHAAEAVVQGVGTLIERGISLEDEATWNEFLKASDLAIFRAGNWGETTAVVLAVTDRWICGASVGDSEGWLVTTDDFLSLTSAQHRKPLLGSGSARPISFHRNHSGGALVVGTDGLFKFAPTWKICQAALDAHPDESARSLISLVRLPNGKLQDDIGFVVCRIAPT